MFPKRGLFICGAAAASLVASVVVPPPAASIRGGATWPKSPANNAIAFVQFEGTNSWCSGTLVSPRIVLTAGHCIKHPEPNPPLHEPNWKKNPEKLSHDDWEQPGRFYPHARLTIMIGPDLATAISRTADEYAIFTSTDSALLRFGNPVSLDHAIPAPVLTRTPGVDPTFWNAKTVTLVGSHSSNVNLSGTFRTNSTNAASCDPNLPNYLCMTSTGSWSMIQGDSGGPGFWSDPAGQRWLVSTNGIGKLASDTSPGGSPLNVRTSHRGAETATAIFPDQQIYFDRILGAADIAFGQFNSNGTPVAGSTQVAQGYEPRASRSAVGVYNVTLPKVVGANTVIATAHGDSRAFCQARSASMPASVVECFSHATGQRTDTAFSILSTSRWADAHALINANGTSPVVTRGRAPGSTQRPTVTRTAVGQYAVSFPGMVGTLGNVLVSAVQGSGKAVKCSVVRWTGASANVGCTAGSTPTDHSFSVLGARKDNLEKRSDMFAWANDPAAAQYVVSPTYSQMNDGTPVADRIGTGHYRIRFNGAQNTFNGVFQATPYGRPDVSCGVTPGTFTAIIKCTGQKGLAVDTQYVVRYLKPQN